MNYLLGAIVVLIAGFGVGVWCALITLIAPEPVRIARNSALVAPFTALLVGFLALAAGFGLTALLTISLQLIVTIVCIPIVAILDLFLLTTIAFGVVVVAEPIGHVILRRRGIYAAPIAAAAIGGSALTIGLIVLNSLPFGLSIIGQIALVVTLSAGVGSLMLTRFGRRPYPLVHYV